MVEGWGGLQKERYHVSAPVPPPSFESPPPGAGRGRQAGFQLTVWKYFSCCGRVGPPHRG